jgi:hypothetical protein
MRRAIDYVGRGLLWLIEVAKPLAHFAGVIQRIELRFRSTDFGRTLRSAI